MPGFVPGGKSGTAHKYDPATHRYAPDRYLSSFAGLVPIANPRIAIVVVVDDPSGGDYFGGKVAGPVFGQIASESLRYLGVPGDAPVEPPPPAAPGKGPAKAAAAAAAAPPAAAADDEAAEVIEPAPDALEGATTTVPDFRGAGVARAVALAAERGVAIEVRGSGRCLAQSIPPGPAALGATVTLEFGDAR